MQLNDKYLVTTPNGQFYRNMDSGTFPSFLDLGGGYCYGKWTIVRGKSLGSVVTDEQWEEIRGGTFRNIMLGDYWKIGNTEWRVVDFDYYRRTTESEFGDLPHHIVITALSPQTVFGKVKMNDTNTTNGGFYNSKINTTYLGTNILPIIEAAFGSDHILNKRLYEINSVDSNGNPIGGLWTDNKVSIPNETMIFGTRTFSSRGVSVGLVNGCEAKQLAYFSAQNRWMPRSGIWLKDVADTVDFSIITYSGVCGRTGANATNYIMPTFAIYAP